jgi:hypothetical protein
MTTLAMRTEASVFTAALVGAVATGAEPRSR